MSAAYLRGISDGIIMRAVDVILSFPQLVFALLLLSLLGPKLWLITIAVGVSHAPQVARVLRSATLDLSERDFVKAAELQGMRPAKVMRKEILPNLVSPLMVEAGLRLTYSIVIIAGLAFLGFGQPPPASNWGTMINENRVGLPLNPWAVVVPALLIAVLTIGTNTFTDAFARVAIGVDRRARGGGADRGSPPGAGRVSVPEASGRHRVGQSIVPQVDTTAARRDVRLEVTGLEVRLGRSGPDVVRDVSSPSGPARCSAWSASRVRARPPWRWPCSATLAGGCASPRAASCWTEPTCWRWARVS